MPNLSSNEQDVSACLVQLSDILTSGRPPGSRCTNDGPAEISQHLYVGSGSDAVNRRLLNRLRITHVLNCTSAETIKDYGEVGFRVVEDRYKSSSLPVAENPSSFERQNGPLWSSWRPETSDRASRTYLAVATMPRSSSQYARRTVDFVPNSCPKKKPSRPYSSSSVIDVTRRKELSFSAQLPPFTSFDDGYSRRTISGSRHDLYAPSNSMMTSMSSLRTTDGRRETLITATRNCFGKPFYQLAAPTENAVRDVIANNDVIFVRRGDDGSPYDPERSTVRAYLEIHADDTPGYPLLRLHYDAVRRFIDSAQRVGGRALIHCELGINRSVTLAVAYLIDTEGVALTQAVRQLRAVRPNVLRNEGFRRQLAMFAAERKLLGCR